MLSVMHDSAERPVHDRTHASTRGRAARRALRERGEPSRLEVAMWACAVVMAELVDRKRKSRVVDAAGEP